MESHIGKTLRYRLAIFDFDGTLADSADWAFAAINELAARHGFRAMCETEREAMRGRSARELMSLLGVSSWRLPWVVRDFRRLAARDIAQIRLFPWVGELFAALGQRDIAIAIVSSNSEANVRQVLGSALATRVRHYGCGASLFGKPSKLRAALRAHATQANNAVAVGDEIRDVEAAQTAGIAAVAVGWGYALPEALARAQPARLVHTPEELLAYLSG